MSDDPRDEGFADTSPPPTIRVLPPPQDDYEWQGSLSRKSNGTVESSLGNAIIILSNAKEWKGIRYNKFTQTTTLHSPPVMAGFAPPKPELDEYSASFVSHWLARRERIKLGNKDVMVAVDAAGKQPDRAYHPVRDYLEGIEWDGTPRIDSWLSDFITVEDSPYASAVGRMWLISAVARVMQPGCKADHMLLFEGKQGYGKSTALRALAGKEWFFDSRLDLGSKDCFEVLRGKWILELAELDSFKGREATRVKAFLTSSTDSYRKSYGRTSQDVDRQCIISGSTNESYYLNDPSGNRRFWPVRILRRIDTRAIEAARDQLWAEAYSEYDAGQPWHITDPKLLEASEEQQGRRQIEHPWEGIIAEWVSANGTTVAKGLTIRDVCYLALQIDAKDMGHHGTVATVSAALAKLGMAVKPGMENERPRRYFRSDDL